MAKYSNTVEYNIRTTLDNSGIAKLQSELTQLQNKVNTMGAKGLIPQTSLNKTLSDIKTVQTALTNAFNPKLGMLNTTKFMNELKTAGLSMNQIYQSFSNAGAAGTRAFTSFYGQVSKIDTGLRSISKTTDKIINTMGNTFRWGVIASAFAGMMNSVHQAAQYTQDLDKSLTNIMMVSGETRENMNAYARIANEVAQKLGSTTVAMTDATQVFIQQGYDLQKSQQLAQYSTVLGNVSQQDTKTASDEITAYMNAYKIPLEDIGNALSKWSEVANVSAADVEELSVASQKAASVATTVGVDMDHLAATIATIETVTREAPENIGNGLKTIYSRLSDVKLGETLEDGVDLGQITSALSKVGVQVLDDAGKMRDVGVIVEDLMDVWGTLDQTQKAATATTLAGRFQLARFEALMNRSDLYKEYLGASRAQTGTETLDSMQSDYERSLEGRLNTLQSKIEEVFLNIFNSDSFNGVVDALSGLVDVLNDLIKATGGGETALLGIAAVMTKLAGNSIARGASNFITNRIADRQGTENLQAQQQLARQQLRGEGLNVADVRMNKFANDIAQINRYAPIMNEEQQRRAQELTMQRVQAENALSEAESKRISFESQLRVAAAAAGVQMEKNINLLLDNIAAAEKDGVAIDFTSKEFEELTNYISSSTKAFSEFIAKLESNPLQITSAEIDKVTASLRKMVDEEIITAEQSKKITAALNGLKGANSIKQIDAALKDANITMAQLVGFLEGRLPRDINEAAEQMYHFSAASVDAATSVTYLEGQFTQFSASLKLQEVMNGFAGIANGALSALFAIQSLTNLMSILSDETKSPFEKLEAGAMDFAMVLALGLPAIQQTGAAIGTLKTALQEFSAAQQIATAVKAAGIVVTEAEIVATEEEAAATMAARIAEIGSTDARLGNVAAALAEAAVEGVVSGEKAAEIAVTYGVTEATVAETAAKTGLTIANTGLLATVLPLIAAAAPFIAIAAAVAGTIGLIVHLVGEADKSFHRFDTAVVEAGEHVKQANEAYKRSTILITDIDSALKGLDENPFESLTRGTQEWNEALQKTNNSVLELIDKYPELAQYVEHDQNTGALIFNEQGLKAQREIAEQQQASAAAMMVAAKQEELAAKNRRDAVNLVREGDYKALKTASTSSTYVEGAADANGAPITINGYDESGAGAQLEKAATYMAEHVETQVMSTEELTKTLADNLGVSEEVATELAANKDSIYKLGADLQQNTVALQSATQAYAAQVMTGTGKYDNADANVQGIVDKQVAGYLNDTNNEYYQQASKQVSDMSDSAKRAAYAEQMGYVVGKNGEYYTSTAARDSGDESGKVNWDNIDIDTALIGQAIAEAIRNNADGIVGPVQEAYDDIKNKIGEKGANLFAGEGEINGGVLRSMTASDFEGLDFSLLSESDLNAMGFFEENGKNAWENFREAFNEAAKENPINTEEAMKASEAAASMGPKDADVDKEQFKQLAEYIGENAEEMEGFSEALEEDADELAEVTEEILRYDKSLEKAQENLEDWQKLLESDAVEDHAKAAEELSNVYNDLLDVGEGLSVSDAFATNPENLELLQAAINGDIDAYDELQRRAAEDIVTNIAVDDSAALASLDNLWAEMDAINFNDIEIGATIDDSGFIEACENMINAAGMSAEQAEAALSSMGIDAEVESETTEQQDPQTYVSLMPQLVPRTFTSTLPIGEGKDVKMESYTGTVYGVQMIPQIAQTTASKMFSAFGMKVTGSGGKSSGGSLKIKSAKKGAGGGAKYANASHGGGASGGGKGGGGGGGGGGGSKTKSVEKAKSAESNDDIYNKVNSKLEELADNYTEVDKAKGRAYGDKYRKAAEKEINNLQKQNALLKERNKISEAKKQALISGQDNPDYGIYLKGESLAKYGLTDADNDGTIDNYIQKYNEALAKQNAAQKAADDYWNSLGGEMNEDQQEHYKKLQEAQKDAAEYANKILDVTNEYQEVCDKIRDDTEQILENEHEMEDIAIDLFQTATKTVDTLKDLNESKGWLQGLFTNRESDSPFRALVEDLNLLEGLFGTTTTNANLFFKTMIDGATDAASKQFWTDARDQAQNKFGNGTSILDMRQFYLEKLLSQEGRNIYGSNEKQYYEDLQDLYNDIIGDMKDVESKYEDVLDDIIDAYDELADRMEFRNEQLEYELNFLEHQRDMIELIHGDESYDMFGIVNQAQVEGTLQKVNEAKLQYDYWVRERDKYNKETQKELWEEMDKKAREFGEALTDATKEAADAMAKQYEDATEAVIQHFRDELFGGTLGDAGFFEKEWEMANDQAEQYLDNVERGMELEKLRGRIQKIQDDVIDATDQKYADRAKAILKALEDQKKAIINNQGELEYVNALSQFDVDLANAKIEALQKQIALEEAQRNKNQMQLRRDTQGNYRYVYRANQDDILSAQEELADSEYEIYEMSKERYSDILNERWQVQQEYEDKVRFANERYKDDQDKLNKALNEINEWYVERQVNLGLELKDAQEGMIEGVQHLAEDTSDYVSQMFEDIADSMQENWADTLEQIGVIYSAELHNLTEDTDKFRERVQQAQDETITAAETFDDKLRVLEDTAETSFSNINEIINDVTKDMSSLNESTEEFMRIIRGDTGEIDDATLALERYQKQIESLQSSSSALASSLRQAQNELDSKTREAANYKTQIEKVSKGDGYFDKDGVYHDNPKSTSGSNNNGYTDSQIAWGIAQNIWTYGSWGNDPDRHSRITARYGEAIANLTQQYINEYASTGDLVNWGSDVWGYATGGYTGTWVDGSKDTEGGRLALLHQKELVLNAQDTENLLGAVDIVRQIINNMKNTDALNMPSMFGVNSNVGDSIEQRVEIVAEFPNVDTAEDIREALLSLADNAFQYAYKTR